MFRQKKKMQPPHSSKPGQGANSKVVWQINTVEPGSVWHSNIQYEGKYLVDKPSNSWIYYSNETSWIIFNHLTIPDAIQPCHSQFFFFLFFSFRDFPHRLTVSVLSKDKTSINNNALVRLLVPFRFPNSL